MTESATGASRAGGDAGRRDAGSATVWTLTLLPVVVLATGVALLVTQAVTVRHRAALAADQAALAAAGRAQSWQLAARLVDLGADAVSKAGVEGYAGAVVARAGSTLLIQWRACSAARSSAEANGARVVSCTVVDGVADVSVVVPARGLVGRLGGGHGRARAGPREAAPDIPFDLPTLSTRPSRPSH